MQANKTPSDQDIYRFLGLCMKAGKLVSGEDQVIDAVRKGSTALVIVALDASENSKKRYADKCTFYKIQTVVFGSCDNLGKCTGKKKRAALAVMDQGFAKALNEKLLQYHQVYSEN